MIALLGSVGWGLLTFGAVTHMWHHRRLRALLALHLDHDRLPARALTAIEVVLAVAIPIAFVADHRSLPWLGAAAGLIALGFMVWIGRLLLTGSDLPCACSFSERPTSVWSFARSACVALVAWFVIVVPSDAGTASEQSATLAVGLALAGAIFVVPEAITWPDASRALMQRVDAHTAATASEP